MPDPSDLDVDPPEIAYHVAQQTFGTGAEVICGQCSGTIEEGSSAWWYAVERGDGSWFAARIFHGPDHDRDCFQSTVFHRHMVENPKTSTDRAGEAIGTGTVVFDPNIRDFRPSEDELAENFAATFGGHPDDVAVHMPAGHARHRLTDIAVTHVVMPGEEVTPLDPDDE